MRRVGLACGCDTMASEQAIEACRTIEGATIYCERHGGQRLAWSDQTAEVTKILRRIGLR
jgi:hypothetical protein